MLRGRVRHSGERLLLWLALAAGIGRAAVCAPRLPAEDLPDVIRSYVGAAADTISLPPPANGTAYVLVFLPPRPGGDRPPVDLDRIGRVRWRSPRAAILEFDPVRAAELVDSYEILPFPKQAPGTLRAARELPPPPAFPDAGIAAAVDQVDTDRLMETVGALVGFGTRRSSTNGGFEAQAYVHDLFTSYGLTDVTDFDYNPWCDDVVAVQPGFATPERIYVIGGHYDSYSRTPPTEPGADDNASGTAGVLEAARILSRMQFESTIIYIAFSGEEEGLIGSDAWAAWASGRGLDIRAMLNFDMLGYVAPGDSAAINLITNGLYPAFEEFSSATIALYLPGEPVVTGGSVYGGSSDQASFWGIGVPGLWFFEDPAAYSPYIHTPEDAVGPSLNNPAFMRRNVQAGIAVLATLANPLRVWIAHVPIVDQSEKTDGYPIEARIRADAPLVEDSLIVRYRVDLGPFASLPLTIAGDSGLYNAVIPRQPGGSVVEYEIHARDADGRIGDDPPGAPAILHSFEVGFAASFYDRLEDDCGWTVGAPGDSATTGIWTRGTPIGTGAQPGWDADRDSAGSCYFTGNGIPGGGQGEQDVDGGRTSLTSPPMDLSRLSRVRLEYARWFVDETNPDDTLRVLLSNDDGATWRPVETVVVGERAWKTVRFDSIETLLPMTDRMRVRFVAEDGGGPSLVEAAIDNFRVKGSRAPTPSPQVPRPVAALEMRASPNPFRETTTIAFDMPAQARPQLGIYDARGGRVAVLPGAPLPAGREGIVWNGRDARGRPAPAGIYFARLESAGASPRRTVRIVRVR